LQRQPNNGVAPLSSLLTATVSGNVSGNTTYSFDCTADGSWDNVVTNSGNTATYTCNYATTGTFTAKVKAERGGLTVWGNSVIITR
jgi:hypothetical protein